MGTMEEVLVETVAQEYWRLSVAAWREADQLGLENPFTKVRVHSLLRYQTTINRQLFQAMNQLERLQRFRKGENIPAPLNLQVTGDGPIMQGDQKPGVTKESILRNEATQVVGFSIGKESWTRHPRRIIIGK